MTDHYCAECGQLKPVTDWRGCPVDVTAFDPPDGGADPLVIVALTDNENGDNAPTLMMLTYEMADRLAVELASIAEARRQFRLETADKAQP